MVVRMVGGAKFEVFRNRMVGLCNSYWVFSSLELWRKVGWGLVVILPSPSSRLGISCFLKVVSFFA